MGNHLLITKMLILFTCLAALCASCEALTLSQIINDDGSTPDGSAEEFLNQTPSESMLIIIPPGDIHCDLFVAPDGDDSHRGTEENPWSSFQHAACVAARCLLSSNQRI